MTDTYVTLEHKSSCVTLAVTKNMSRPCAGVSIHGILTGDLTVNSRNEDCEVPFDILLACLANGKYQTKLYFLTLFSQNFLNLSNSRAKLN